MKKVIRISGQIRFFSTHFGSHFRKWMPVHRRAAFSTLNEEKKSFQTEPNKFSEDLRELETNTNSCAFSYPLKILKIQLGEIEGVLTEQGVSVDKFVIDCLNTLEENMPGSESKDELSSSSITSYLFQLGKFLATTNSTLSFDTGTLLLDAIADFFGEYMSIVLITNIFHLCLKNFDSLNDRFWLFRRFKEKFKKNTNMGMLYTLFDPEACNVVEAFQKTNLERPNPVFKNQKEIIDYLMNVLINDRLIFVLQSVNCNIVIMKLIADLDFKEFTIKQLIQMCFILRPIQKYTKKQTIENADNINFILSKIETMIPLYKLIEIDRIRIGSIKKGSLKLDNLSPIFLYFVQAVIREALIKDGLEINVSFVCVFNNINLHHLDQPEIRLLQKYLLEKPLPKDLDLAPCIIFFHLAHLYPQFDPQFEIRFKILNHCKEEMDRLEFLNSFNIVALITSLRGVHQEAGTPTNSKDSLSPEKIAIINHLMEVIKKIFIKNQFNYNIKTQEQILGVFYYKMNIISESEYVNELEEKFCQAVTEDIKDNELEVVERTVQILTKNPTLTKERAKRIQQALRAISLAIENKKISRNFQKICLEEMKSLYMNCKKAQTEEVKGLIEEIENFVVKMKKVRTQF